MRTKLIILGAGGHCKSCIDVIEAQGEYQIAGIVKPKFDTSETVLGYSIIGSDDDLERLLISFPAAIIAVGQIKTPDIRMRLFQLLKNYNAQLPVIKSPNSYCASNVTVGEGTILMHGSIVNVSAEIGSNCIINSGALVEHDTKIGNHCHIATGVRVNGGVVVGQGCFIGSGSIIREGVKVGDRAIISAGEIVLRDVPDAATVRSRF